MGGKGSGATRVLSVDGVSELGRKGVSKVARQAGWSSTHSRELDGIQEAIVN